MYTTTPVTHVGCLQGYLHLSQLHRVMFPTIDAHRQDPSEHAVNTIENLNACSSFPGPWIYPLPPTPAPAPAPAPARRPDYSDYSDYSARTSHIKHVHPVATKVGSSVYSSTRVYTLVPTEPTKITSRHARASQSQPNTQTIINPAANSKWKHPPETPTHDSTLPITCLLCPPKHGV